MAWGAVEDWGAEALRWPQALEGIVFALNAANARRTKERYHAFSSNAPNVARVWCVNRLFCPHFELAGAQQRGDQVQRSVDAFIA